MNGFLSVSCEVQGHANSGDADEHDRGRKKQLLEVRRFSGRARRAEYWWFYLFNMIATVIVTLALAAVFPPQTPEQVDLLANIYPLAVLLPSLAVSARRLHDTGHSGWWLLIALTGIGMLLLLVWFVMKGERGPNRHGPDPLEKQGYSRPV